MENIFIFLAFCFGTIIGSFLNVVVWRLPRGEALTGRSHCPHCGGILGVLDLFPVFSFIFLRGRCRRCKAKISRRYLILEIVTGLLFASAVYFLQPADFVSGFELLKYFLVLSALVVVFMVDLEHFLILDQVVFPVAAAMFLLNLLLDLFGHVKILSFYSSTVSGILGAAALFGFFFLVWLLSKGKWIGFGDVKLAVFLGLSLGWPFVLVGLMLAVLSGGIVSVFLLAFFQKTLKSQIPFGTFLAFGTVLALFYGDKLIGWYLAILGF